MSKIGGCNESTNFYNSVSTWYRNYIWARASYLCYWIKNSKENTVEVASDNCKGRLNTKNPLSKREQQKGPRKTSYKGKLFN